ncbi:hypothetical protein K458DRAFT_148106 [Lentithecium fluviatile CBS 122367]|uniref:Wax synthase domain-containing protein n=1 Tax=Lentithecium fluviatile CBS 122367 TaxID=1168545 RepID=A0A6G1JE87_9PLEO|nr:hypothetical protein K458DRAFT_148106 [Lentithecium fluviatile CBS 122367]
MSEVYGNMEIGAFSRTETQTPNGFPDIVVRGTAAARQRLVIAFSLAYRSRWMDKDPMMARGNPDMTYSHSRPHSICSESVVSSIRKTNMSAAIEEWSLSTAAWPLFWFAALIFTCLIITSFPNQLNRWTAVSILMVPTSGAFRTADGLSPDDVLNDVYLRFVIILASHITALCFRDAPPGGGLGRNSNSAVNYWTSGYKLVFNARGVGTSWEVPHLWPGQRSTAELASIVRRLVRQCVGGRSTIPVTKRELAVRVHGAVANFLPDYLMLSAYHDFFAIFFMAVGLDQSWEWPPLFGQISEAYSMRRFWSLFWHKLIYRSFNSHAATISRGVGINQKTVVSRLVNNYLVFLLSGIMHGAVMWKFGIPCAWSASMQYWLLQPVAFVLEGVVQHCWGRFGRSRLSWVRPSVLAAFERIVGYMWVVAWLVWEAPKRDSAISTCNAR